MRESAAAFSTVKRLSAELALTEPFLWRLIREGKIKVIRFGRRAIRIPADEVERLRKDGLPSRLGGGK